MSAPLGAGWDRDRLNAWLRYHSEISYTLTMQRTALESALDSRHRLHRRRCASSATADIPRWCRRSTPPCRAEEIGRAGHAFANQIDPVRLWAVPNFTFLGRTVLAGAGVIDTDTVLDRLAPVVDFWERAARAYRFDDGTHQAADADGRATPYREHVAKIANGCRPVDDDDVACSACRASTPS